MSNQSQQDRFSYQATKDGSVLLYADGRLVKALASRAASRFLAKIEPMNSEQAQLLMAKETGQFKFGNEK